MGEGRAYEGPPELSGNPIRKMGSSGFRRISTICTGIIRVNGPNGRLRIFLFEIYV